MGPSQPISRDDLKAAAGHAGFDTVLPLLVRRLIQETAGGLTSLDMPGGSGTATGGFDGVVTATCATTFVPAGMSVWELSVGGGQTKADDDYSKRLGGPDGLPTQDVTYVEALLVPWTKARVWATDRSADGRWKEVRGYNLDRIHAWLDSAPATTVWLAEALGKSLQGVSSLGHWWTQSWLPSTQVPLDRSIVLAGRDEAADDLVERLHAGQAWVTLGGELRLDDARAFVAAALESASDAGTLPLSAKALVVSEVTGLASLIAQDQPMVLLLTDPRLARDLPSTHPHQIVVVRASGEADVNVPRLSGAIVERRLAAAGIDEAEAAKLGVLARRSLLALRRALANHRESLTPDWAAAPDTVQRRLLLIGSWDDQNEQDRALIGECVGQPYERVEERTGPLAAGADVPFLARVDDIWHIVALEDSWTLLAPALTTDDLNAAREATLEVLTELDPTLELETADRWTAGVRGIRRRYSDTLRSGLATTLAVAASDGGDVRAAGGATGAHWAQVTVRELLARANGDASHRLWLSLVDVLPLLAEAAPSEFLGALRDALNGPTPLTAALFADAEAATFGAPRSPHVAFGWALETIAWSPEYVDEAAEMLAVLASADPGGRTANRPDASLAGILSAWFPNTTASPEHRIRIIQRIYRTARAIGVRLLLDLIPDGHSFQMLHVGPRFRDWKRPSRPSREDFDRVVCAVTDLLLDVVETSPENVVEIVERIDDLPASRRTDLLTRLTALGSSLTDENPRAEIYDALREVAAKHREFSDAQWAMPEREVEEVERARDAMTPKDLVRRHAWLFRSGWTTLGDVRRRDDYVAYEEELLRRRAFALGEILADRGLGGLSALSIASEEPHLVGSILAEHTTDFDTEMVRWLEADENPTNLIAAGYVRRRLRSGDESLLGALLEATESPLTRARILRASGEPLAAWARLAELGSDVAELYWKEFTPFGLGPGFSAIAEAAWSLLDVDRPSAALTLVALYSGYSAENSSAELADVVAVALERLLAGGFSDPEFMHLDSYNFEQLFTLLARHRDEVGKARVVSLEWQYFPTLGYDAEAPTLHEALAEDPDFFVEVVSALFHPETSELDEPTDPQTLERRRALARRAFDVLHTFRRVPGRLDNGEIDVDVLRSWITSARGGLAAADRTKTGDHQIGQLLAHAPASDGSPVHEVVRALLEEIRSEDIETGLFIGIRNQRGVTSRDPLDGGDQERLLAAAYLEFAQQATDSPRARRLLKALSDAYANDARREDDRAERRRQGLGF